MDRNRLVADWPDQLTSRQRGWILATAIVTTAGTVMFLALGLLTSAWTSWLWAGLLSVSAVRHWCLYASRRARPVPVGGA